jgi:glycosyltransferase involved in cell wall biosynthesis
MAAGRPVIAYAGGGALDYVDDGITGTFFREQTPESLADAVLRFDGGAYDPALIRAHAEKFDVSVFKSRLARFIQERMGGEWS